MVKLNTSLEDQDSLSDALEDFCPLLRSALYLAPFLFLNKREQ
jgi:hypothetical protein